jgi:hypothetical protein
MSFGHAVCMPFRKTKKKGCSWERGVLVGFMSEIADRDLLLSVGCREQIADAGHATV